MDDRMAKVMDEIKPECYIGNVMIKTSYNMADVMNKTKTFYFDAQSNEYPTLSYPDISPAFFIPSTYFAIMSYVSDDIRHMTQ